MTVISLFFCSLTKFVSRFILKVFDIPLWRHLVVEIKNSTTGTFVFNNKTNVGTYTIMTGKEYQLIR